MTCLGLQGVELQLCRAADPAEQAVRTGRHAREAGAVLVTDSATELRGFVEARVGGSRAD